MPETPNPYIAGSPITGPEMFFGREDVFTFIRQALTGQHRDNVLVIYGQRRTGKTSVLYQMSRQLGDAYVCIFVDLHGLALNGVDGFLWELANHIARVLRRDHQITLPPLDRAAFQDNSRSAFEDAFLDSVWAAIGDRHLLLMLDEAIRLEEQVQAGKMDIQIFDYLRHLMQHHPQLDFLFSLGSGLEEMQKEYAFLFNVALYKKISFLDRASAVALITEPVKDRCPFQPEAVERILQVTSGHPYFTQLVCHSLFNRCQGEPFGVSAADVDAVLDEAVERGLAVLKHIWEESTPGEKAVLAAMATSPSAGSASAPAVPDQVIRVWAERGLTLPEGEAARSVRSLVARDVISGVDAYAFTVDLMRLWIQKFRRLEWVKEEIDEAAQAWARQDQERRSREAQATAVPAAPPSVPALESSTGDVRPVDSSPAAAATRQHPTGAPTAVTPAAAAPRRPISQAILYVLLALAALLAIAYFASGLLQRRAPVSSPANPVGAPAAQSAAPAAQSAAPATALTGEAANVNDLAVLGGYVWAATDGGLVRWSADRTYRLFPFEDLDLDCINAIVARPDDDTLWLGCGGVTAIRIKDGEIKEYLGYYNRDDGLEMGTVRAVAIDQNGVAWAGGVPDEGHPPPLSAFAGKSADPPWHSDDAINAQLVSAFAGSPNSINISSIFAGPDDGFLIGLHDDGIVYVDREIARYYGEEKGVGQPGQQDRRIRSILIDQHGSVWAAASEQGLLRLTDWNESFEKVRLTSDDPAIYSVAEFEDGSLWVGGDYIVATSDDGGETWSPVGGQASLSGEVDALVRDDAGLIWAGTYGNGVSVWDGQQWKSVQK